MVTEAIGTLFGEETSPGSDVYTTIAGVKDASGLEISVTMADTTTLDSPSGYREQIPTKIEVSDLELDMIFSSTVHSTLNTRMAARTAQNYRLTFPDSATITVSGYIGGIGVSAAQEGEVQANVTLKISGVPTFA